MVTVLQVRGKHFQQLVEALVDAFPDTNALTMMLQFRLGKNLAQIVVLPNPTNVIAFQLITSSNAEGWTAQLIAAARESRPRNPKLLKLGQDFGLTAATAQLERTIRDDLSFIEINKWRTRLGEIEGQVCRVETPNGIGTGFLLGPDVVMTNYHVMESIIKQPNLASQVVLRFDYKRLSDGTTLNPGTPFKLAANWLLDHSPYSKVDLLTDPGDQVPDPDQLDYTLMRLETEAGNEPIAGATAEPTAPHRKWIALQSPVPAFPMDAPVFIVQHPEAWPLKLAMDTRSMLGTNGNGTRIRYRTNTEKGSSGSPVFNATWDIAALHHSGDRAIVPVYNQGIPFEAILTLLDQRGKKNLIGDDN